MVVEEAVIKGAFGIDGRRIIRTFHFCHAFDKFGMSKEGFEIFLDGFEREVDFLPAGLRGLRVSSLLSFGSF